MTGTRLELENFDDVAAELRALAGQADPVLRARPELARQVLHRYHRRHRAQRAGLTLAASVALAGGLAAAAHTGHPGYRAVIQPSDAMAPTVAMGQTVLLRTTLIPQRGDVVLAHVTEDGLTYDALKRVIALPGDTVGCPATASGGCVAVRRNGVPLNEPYLNGGTQPFRTVVVPAGEVFLIGDNRLNSNDSRFYGPVPLDDVTGVAVRLENAAGAGYPVPGAPSHPGPPHDGVEDLPAPVPSAQVAPAH